MNVAGHKVHSPQVNNGAGRSHHHVGRMATAIRGVKRASRLQRLPVTIERIRSASLSEKPPQNEIVGNAEASDNRLDRAKEVIRRIRQISLSSWYAKRVSDAYRREYEARHRAQMLALLEGARWSGLPVPVLSACGRGTAEIRFTQLLRHFLDPGQPHGLGHLPLVAAFGKTVSDQFSRGVDIWQNAVVKAEVDLGFTKRPDGRLHSNHLDILVVASDVAVLIEQKIRSSENTASIDATETGRSEHEQVRQLSEYSEAFERSRAKLAPNARCIAKVYLTPDGRKPSHSDEWSPLSHFELIRRFLTIDATKLSQVARHNLITFLWDLACGPLELANELRGRLPELERAIASADRGRLGPYLNWRRNNHGSLFLLMEILQILREGVGT